MDFRQFCKRITIHALTLVRNVWDECIRKMKKMGEKRGKTADFGVKFGEMERNGMAATCEHNYGADFDEDFKAVTILSRISILC